MITFKFAFGSGDREAATVSDEFISTPEMARQRAIQELCETYKIVISKELRCVLDTAIDIGEWVPVNLPDLGIMGSNIVTSITTSLSAEGCYEDVSLESYKNMNIPA